MPAIIKGNTTNDKLSEANQREIVERINEAYDRGGADVLKILVGAAKEFAIQNPDYEQHANVTLALIEVVREGLQKAVATEVHDTLPKIEKPILIQPV